MEPAGGATIQLTERDIVDAYRLVYWDNLRQPDVFVRLIVVVLLVLAGIAWLMTGGDWSRLGDWRILGPLLVGFSAAFIVPTAIVYLLSGLNARKTLREQKTLQPPVDYTWTPEGYGFSSTFGSSVIPWSTFARFAENDRVFLLYESRRLYRMLPKRALSEADIETIRRFTGLK